MPAKYTQTEKDEILRKAFSKLKECGVSSKWSLSSQPFSDLCRESRLLMEDAVFVKVLDVYLTTHNILPIALNMFFTHISMAARAQWYNVPDDLRPITARGWFLGRWIPTFLIVDGPIGRFISKGGSPLFLQLQNNYAKYPLLASARDFMNNDIFRQLRNGFGHWAFDWEVVGKDSYVVAYDWQNGKSTARLHQEQADGFHIITFALLEIMDDIIISRRNNL